MRVLTFAPSQATIFLELQTRIGVAESVREAVAKMMENSMDLLVVPPTGENTPIGIVTLHDVLRVQHQLSDAAAL
jgi:CBS domain-containing protein